MTTEAYRLRVLADALEEAERLHRFFSQYCKQAPQDFVFSWNEASGVNGYEHARREILVGITDSWSELVELALRRVDDRVADARTKLAEMQE